MLSVTKLILENQDRWKKYGKIGAGVAALGGLGLGAYNMYKGNESPKVSADSSYKNFTQQQVSNRLSSERANSTPSVLRSSLDPNKHSSEIADARNTREAQQKEFSRSLVGSALRPYVPQYEIQPQFQRKIIGQGPMGLGGSEQITKLPVDRLVQVKPQHPYAHLLPGHNEWQQTSAKTQQQLDGIRSRNELDNFITRTTKAQEQKEQEQKHKDAADRATSLANKSEEIIQNQRQKEADERMKASFKGSFNPYLQNQYLIRK